jgi:acyl-CoA reductase-like NAD-dependent aldehyde dehydrogenase
MASLFNGQVFPIEQHGLAVEPEMAPISLPFPRIQIAQLERRAQSFRYIEAQFHRLYDSLTNSASTIKLAIQADSLHGSAEVDFEFALALSELRAQFNYLNQWKNSVETHYSKSGLTDIKRTRPVGIVYIIPSKWTLTYCVLSALGAAMAAGCCVIVEVGHP